MKKADRSRCPVLVLVALAVLSSAGAAARDLSQARPSSVGMSAARLDRITALMQGHVDEGVLPGAVTLVARNGKIVYFEAVGKRDIESDVPMSRDTLFRIYSMTKPVTAVAAMILYEEGAFQLSDSVAKFLPELAELAVLEDGEEKPLERPITMHQLLTHTAGFSYGFSRDDPVDAQYQEDRIFESKNLDEFVRKVARIPLRYRPGERWHYSIAVDLTGAVIERISGERFDRFLARRLFEPLGMEDTFFNVPPEKRERLGANHAWSRERNALVAFRERGYPVYEDTTFFSGGGGLVSTAMDYARFAEMLRSGGELDGARILSPKTVEFMTTNHLPAALRVNVAGERPSPDPIVRALGSGFGLGFGVVTDLPATSVVGSVGEYTWGGAAGTIFWVDPVEELVVVGMIQVMGAPVPLRSQLKALTYQALTQLTGEQER